MKDQLMMLKDLQVLNMPTTAIGTNVILAKDARTATIATIIDEENLTKALVMITPPKATGKQETDPDNANYGPNTTKILDILNKAEQRITVDGYLATGLRNASEGDSSTNAEGKKSDIKKMFLGGGVIKMVYEGDTFNVIGTGTGENTSLVDIIDLRLDHYKNEYEDPNATKSYNLYIKNNNPQGEIRFYTVDAVNNNDVSNNALKYNVKIGTDGKLYLYYT